jgi:hypothetical protein
MTLYYINQGSGLWSDSANWFQDVGGITNPVTIASGSTWRVQLEYDSALAAWVLTGWTGGYS